LIDLLTQVSRGKTTYCASHGGVGAKCRIAGCNATVYGNLKVCEGHIDHNENPLNGDNIRADDDPDIDWDGDETNELP
jgi:hypothetical protein